MVCKRTTSLTPWRKLYAGIKLIGVSVAIVAVGAAFAGEDELAASLESVFAKSADHYLAIDAKATPLAKKDSKGNDTFPHGWKAAEGSYDMRSVLWWTSGHFSGTLWYLYEATGKEALKEAALKWSEKVALNSKVDTNHDVGFIMQCSFGNARRILKTDRYDALLVETADSLSRRYNDGLGLIRSWGKKDEPNNFLVIPDNLMNLEVLETATQISGDSRFDRMARSHAIVTAKHHFRADGGCYHVLDYDQVTKRVKEVRRGQGASTETAWSRGQSWAIYGYTMMYRFTRDPFFLETAQKCADFAIDNPNMPADGVPYWDYGAPGEERDSSAGSIMASAMLELSTFLPGAKGTKYRAFAVKTLTSLASPAYFAAPGENGDFLLMHGVGAKPKNNREVDVPLVYGDYYFVEALLRFRSLFSKGSL